MLLSFNNGELIAFSTASFARFSPEDSAEPITDVPAFFITVLTSSKSTLILPGTVTISAIHLAPVAIILSAFSNALL